MKSNQPLLFLRCLFDNRLSLRQTGRLFIRAGLIVCLSLCHPVSAQAYTVTAQAAIFSNSTKVIRYYGKNVHKRVLPASTTKVLTALLVIEHLDLNARVGFSSRAVRVQPSKLGARVGESFTVRDLLYALLLKSANDAAVALAEKVAGSEQKFVAMMNRRAKQLGARHSRFANPHGLPSRSPQYTTAYDMYLIFREAVKHPVFRTIIHHKTRTIVSNRGRRYYLKNHNKILFFNWKRPIYGKTGWTRKAGACFVGYITKGKDICIVAVFNARRRWDDIKHIVSRYGGIAL